MRQAWTLRRALSTWEGSLRVAGKAEGTISSYLHAASMIEAKLGQHTLVDSITLEDLELVASGWRGVSNTTRRNRIVAWREFFAWGERRYGWPNTARLLTIPRRDQPAQRRLTHAELSQILSARHTDHRARLLMSLLAHTGVRAGEGQALLWRDVDLLAGTITIGHRHAKGRKGRVIPLHPDLVRELARTKDERAENAADDCYLIPAHRRARFLPEGDDPVEWRKPISETSWNRLIHQAVSDAGVRAPNEVRGHTFRRSLLSIMLERGESIYATAALAGHSSIEQTAGYGGGASLKAVREAVENQRLCADPPDAGDGRTWDRTMDTDPVRPDVDAGRPGSGLVTPDEGK